MALLGTDPLIGWFEEEEMTKDEILENDKAMRNHGYMKGPASCMLAAKESKNMRASANAIRKVVGQFNITKGDHWLRFKDVSENSTGKMKQFDQDYLELVPVSVITNQQKPEDIY
jgi:hypothetical protein